MPRFGGKCDIVIALKTPCSDGKSDASCCGGRGPVRSGEGASPTR